MTASFKEKINKPIGRLTYVLFYLSMLAAFAILASVMLALRLPMVHLNPQQAIVGFPILIALAFPVGFLVVYKRAIDFLDTKREAFAFGIATVVFTLFQDILLYSFRGANNLKANHGFYELHMLVAFIQLIFFVILTFKKGKIRT